MVKDEGRGTNIHNSGKRADIILCTALLITSIIHRDYFEGVALRDLQCEAFSGSTRGVLTGFYEVQSELLFPQPRSCLS